MSKFTIQAKDNVNTGGDQGVASWNPSCRLGLPLPGPLPGWEPLTWVLGREGVGEVFELAGHPDPAPLLRGPGPKEAHQGV